MLVGIMLFWIDFVFFLFLYFFFMCEFAFSHITYLN
jgi:hypothetical protein